MPHDLHSAVRNRRTRLAHLIDYACGLLLLVTVICVFVPLAPLMPTGGLDPSWEHGMNQATAQGLVFGRDMVFTFGPYASIYTRMYHPATDLMMIAGSLYLALSYAITCVALTRSTQRRWVLTLCAVLAILLQSRDALLFSVPLVVGLFCCKSLMDDQSFMRRSTYAPIQVALLFAPLGFLPLIKGSLLILSVAVCFLSAVLYYKNRRINFALIALVAPLLAMAVFWSAAGQSLADLPHFFVSMQDIISGYTEAMAIAGNKKEILLYGVASAMVLFAVAAAPRLSRLSRLFLFSVYFVFLFLSFKAGFVRHDGHAMAAGGAVLLAAILLPALFQSAWILPAATVAFLSWAYIDSYNVNTSTASAVNNLKITYAASWRGLQDRARGAPSLHRQYSDAIQLLQRHAAFPALQGTADIYSYGQAYLIASNNTWSPRPVLQSYSAYTPALADLNRAHLLSNRAPDNIIFKMEAIDERMPSSEDGNSWPVLLNNYHPTRLIQDTLFLEKNTTAHPLSLTEIGVAERHAFGETVTLPQSAVPLFARIDIQPTLLGRIAGFLMKTSQLNIDITLANGTNNHFRIVSGMARSGFLISPQVDNVAEFGNLYGASGMLDSKIVKSMSISSTGPAGMWKPQYVVVYSAITPVAAVDKAHPYIVGTVGDAASSGMIATRP